MQQTTDNVHVINIIKRVLSEIEVKRDIKILFAVDTGSRSTGLEAPSSDYDLKIIYIQRLRWYLSIEEEVQEEIVEKYSIDGVDIDVMGFNLRKTLQLLRKSNPTLFEMFASPVVYWEEKQSVDAIRAQLPLYFSQKTLSFHYINVAKQNFVDYLRNKKQVNRKKYLYIILTLLRVLYMKMKSTQNASHHENGMEVIDVFPALHYNAVLQPLVECGIVPQKYMNDLNYLIERKKRESGQWEKEEPMTEVSQWIEEMRRETKAYADTILAKRRRYIDTIDQTERNKCNEMLNNLFFDIINRFDEINPNNTIAQSVEDE